MEFPVGNFQLCSQVRSLRDEVAKVEKVRGPDSEVKTHGPNWEINGYQRSYDVYFWMSNYMVFQCVIFVNVFE